MMLGIVPGSFKPLHRGHAAMIQTACNSCDKVMVLASAAARDNIDSASVTEMWQQVKLPQNCSLFVVSNPIRYAYELLGNQDFTDKFKSICVFGGSDQLHHNFPAKSAQKYFPELQAEGRIEFIGLDRGEIKMSGTQMRQFLRDGAQQNFLDNLPPEPFCSQQQRAAIWQILTEVSR